jgi:hypothetical protein
MLLSCSHAATGSDTRQNPSSQADCSPDKPCADKTEFCDYLFPKANVGQGKCTKSCNTQNCADNEVCNPISGACETTCEANSNLCGTIQGQSATCIGTSLTKSYCALQTSNGKCPNGVNLAASAGLCRFQCSGPGTCSNGLVCDAVTNTCEIGCNVSGDVSQCSALAYTPLSSTAAQQVLFACSPVTATCVPQCSGGVCSIGTVRTVCDADRGTCELGCSGCLNSQTLTCKNRIGQSTQPICAISCTSAGFDCPGDLFCQGDAPQPQICQPFGGTT